jgi:hypothetical protein
LVTALEDDEEERCSAQQDREVAGIEVMIGGFAVSVTGTVGVIVGASAT